MNRILDVARLHFMSRGIFVWWPLITIGVLQAIRWVAAAASSDAEAISFQLPLLAYFFGSGIRAVNNIFPFSQTLGVTRREYFFGALLTSAFISAIYAAVAVAFGFAEQATHGWGMDAWFFFLPWVWQNGPAGVAALAFLGAMLLFAAGFSAGTFGKRFKGLGEVGQMVFFGTLIAAFVVWGGTRAEAFFAQTTPVAALWSFFLPLTTLFAAASFLMLRRATP
jgi:hypothetical protein